MTDAFAATANAWTGDGVTMKPSPKYDFPVSVRRQTWEEEPATAPFYEGIFDVELNYSMTLMFVPAFQREPWPPRPPQNADELHSQQEARSMALAMSNYAVTPDDSRAGTEESFAREWLESDTWGPRRPGVLFYVTTQEFAVFGEELARLADDRPFVHQGWNVSEIPDLAITRFLLTRFLASPAILPRDLGMLGR
jgi:hypothetical protein